MPRFTEWQVNGEGHGVTEEQVIQAKHPEAQRTKYCNNDRALQGLLCKPCKRSPGIQPATGSRHPRRDRDDQPGDDRCGGTEKRDSVHTPQQAHLTTQGDCLQGDNNEPDTERNNPVEACFQEFDPFRVDVCSSQRETARALARS
jgi:hypothetical protein